MAINASLVGSGHSAGSSVTTAAGACSTGDTLVAIVAFDPGTTISSITDTAGNTYTLKASVQGLAKLAAYVKENAVGHASNVLTVNFSGAAFPSAHLVKATGAASASFDTGSLASALDADNVAPWTITSGSLAQPASCVIAACEANSTSGVSAYASSNFTVVGSEDDSGTYWTCGVAKLVVSSTSAVTPSFTRTSEASSNASRGLIVFALKEATGGSTYTLTADQGTFTVAGQAANLQRTGGLTAAVGSFGVAGQAANLLVGRAVTAALGTFTVNGQNANLALNLPVVGGHGLDYDFINDGGSSISTSTFTSTPTSIVLASTGRGLLTDYATATVSDNKGNGNYAIVGTAHAYTGFPSSGTALYQKQITAGGAGHAVTASKPTPSDEVTVLAVECLHVNTIVDQQWVEDLSSPNTSASVTTTGPALLVSFWWGSDNLGELGPLGVSSGWTLHDYTSSLASNHVQGASATRTVSAAGTYSIDWTPTTSQGAQVYIVALQQGGSVSLTAATGAFAVAGQAANLVRSYNLTADMGTFTVNGIAANIGRQITLPAAPGAFAVAGQAANVGRQITLSAAVGAFTVAGIDAAFRYNHVLGALQATFGVTGINATLVYSGAPIANVVLFVPMTRSLFASPLSKRVV